MATRDISAGKLVLTETSLAVGVPEDHAADDDICIVCMTDLDHQVRRVVRFFNRDLDTKMFGHNKVQHRAYTYRYVKHKQYYYFGYMFA